RAQALARILTRPDVDLLHRLSHTHQVRAYGFGSDIRPISDLGAKAQPQRTQRSQREVLKKESDEKGKLSTGGSPHASPSSALSVPSVSSVANSTSGIEQPDPALAEATKIGEAIDRTLAEVAGQPA